MDGVLPNAYFAARAVRLVQWDALVQAFRQLCEDLTGTNGWWLERMTQACELIRTAFAADVSWCVIPACTGLELIDRQWPSMNI